MVEAEGSNGLVFENLTLHDTTPQGGTQAEALRIEPGDKATLRDADFISLQDTLLLSGRIYVTGSYIEGNVDFIWGKGNGVLRKIRDQDRRSRRVLGAVAKRRSVRLRLRRLDAVDRRRSNERHDAGSHRR